MSKKETNPHSEESTPQDDISALGEAFSLRTFRYVDIARQERLAGIFARWPLLSELMTARSEGER